MTTAGQFQTQGAYIGPYFNTGSSTIYVGSDVDNGNYSGSLCSVPYFKRGYVNLSGGAGTQTIVVPGNSSIISLSLENRGAAITAGTVTITGRGNGGASQALATTGALSIAANTAQNIAYTSAAPGSGGDYGIPDVGQTYATWTVSASGITGGGGFLYFFIGMIDTSFNTTVGQ